MSTIQQSLARATERLEAAGIDQADREAAWLLGHVLEMSVGHLYAHRASSLPATQELTFWSLVDRRARREPLQYILGSEEFMGLAYSVTRDVLIPRPDTATLVRLALAYLSGPVRIADIGTGSGVIAVTVARHLPLSSVVAVDLSSAALDVARANAARHGVAERITFHVGDLLSPLAGDRFDAILSNPPYIGDAEMLELMPEVKDWEPRLALMAGTDDIGFYRRLLRGAPSLLRPGGLLGVEVGAGQAPRVAELFRQAGFEPSVHKDEGKVERAVIGRLT